MTDPTRPAPSSDTPSDERGDFATTSAGRKTHQVSWNPTAPGSDTPSDGPPTAAEEADLAESIASDPDMQELPSWDAYPAPSPTPAPEASGRPPVHLLLLDIWQALGGDSEAFHPWWAADPSFPDRWAQIVAAVAGNISGLAADTNPPAGALLDIAIQFGAADRGEPT